MTSVNRNVPGVLSLRYNATPGGGAPAPSRLFHGQGDELTNNTEIESGFEKVAIYVSLSDMLPGHVAKSDGRVWKSKLGRLQDIEHASLEILEGDRHWEYGIVERILRRPLKSSSKASSKRNTT